MKRYARGSKALVALLLVFCLLLGMIHAMAVEPRVGRTVEVGSGAELLEVVAELNEEGGGKVVLTKDVSLAYPLIIRSPIEITGNYTILADNGNNRFFKGAADFETQSNGLILVSGSTASLTLSGGVTVDADQHCRCILVTDTGRICLEQCTIQNGEVNASQGGAGICLNPKSTLTAFDGAVFRNNIGNANSMTSGGALYVGEGATADLDDVAFKDNSAHSGGAIYTYHGLVLCSAATTFKGNSASQRGGAIHDHGLVVLLGTTIQGQSSGQYGGAIYVSANNVGNVGDLGRAVLVDATITNNTCDNSGGGVFVADKGQVLVAGSTKITGNIADPDGEPFDSNVCVSTSNSKLITMGSLSCGKGEIGVSTGNPYVNKVLVYSLIPEDLENNNLSAAEAEWTNWGFPAGLTYTMTSGSDGDMSKFAYDSDVFILKQAEGDQKDNMWLTINPNHSGGGSSASPQVIFDLNLPGKAAITYPSNETKPTLSVGEVLTVPTVNPTVDGGAVTYTFLGWYSDATGGTKCQSSVTVGAGTRIYYAQWQIKPNGGGGQGVAGTSGLQLVYYDQNYDGGGFTTAYTFGGRFTFQVTFPVEKDGEWVDEVRDVPVVVPFELPQDPVREGYTFMGWSVDSAAGAGGIYHNSSWAPNKKVTTLYAIWRPNPCTIVWDANEGQGGSTHVQDYGTPLEIPAQPTREGYDFAGWYLDKAGSVQLVSGVKAWGNTTYYAHWTPKEFTITWLTDYTGGAVITVRQKYGEQLEIPQNPVREGYGFVDWWTTPGDGTGAGKLAKDYGPVKGPETFYANWSQDVIDYTVTLEWDDVSNNDAVRPLEVTVALMRNDLPTGQSYPLTDKDADDSGNQWSYTFKNLPKTDSTSREYTYSVAIISSVSNEYNYGIENKSATLGYILMTHRLITRDVPVYLAWADDADRDGLRPEAVRVQLTANGVGLTGGENVATLSGSGDTWEYTFHGAQKYDKAVEIVYGIEVTEAKDNDLAKYDIQYDNTSAILRHSPELTSETIAVVWADSANQDGKRPASMFVQLYADNVPLAEKYVLLSDANGWEYTWTDLYRYADGGREISYSAHVSSTLVDYVAATTGMTIEMTYVPSSTTITAFATWQDGADVDGLRPDFLTVELVANGKPTGDQQILAPTNGWTTVWRGYPIYQDGHRIEYTFRVTDVPDGYSTVYNGIYDTSGLSVTLTHERILAAVPVTLEWDDQDNVALARPIGVKVMLYADETPLPELTAVLMGEDWSHVFEPLPVYRDGGIGIRYSVAVVSEIGGYTAVVTGTTALLSYRADKVTVPLSIRWSDRNNADGLRPDFVVVTLTQNDQLTAYQSVATEDGNWTVSFDGLVAYSPSDSGTRIRYGAVVDVPAGYTATYAGTYCVLSRQGVETVTVTPVLHWTDNNNQYGERPDKMVATLLVNGDATGKTLTLYAADAWLGAFAGLPKYQEGQEIQYSIQVDGQLGAYTVKVVGSDIYLTHKSIQEPDYTTAVTASILWQDNGNALGARPNAVDVILCANGQPVATHTLTIFDAAEDNGDLWNRVIADLPTKLDGKDVVYTLEPTPDSRYVVIQIGDVFSLVESVTPSAAVIWSDNSNQDGQRPEALTLQLVANGEATDTMVTLSGSDDTWTGNFPAVPVWAGSERIIYTFQLNNADAAALTAARYTVNIKDGVLTLTRRSSSNSGGSISRPSNGSSGLLSGGSGSGGSSAGGGGGGSTATETPVLVSAYVTGYVDGTFRPSGALARCEAVAIFARVSQGYAQENTYAVPAFLDVPADAWYSNYLGYCVEQGIITGYVDGTFRPYDSITREEFAAMAARFLGMKINGEDLPSSFGDVMPGSWAEGYIAQLAKQGIVAGDEHGNFKPCVAIDRASAVKIVNGILGRDPDETALTTLTEEWFTDMSGHWAFWHVAEAAFDHEHMVVKNDK